MTPSRLLGGGRVMPSARVVQDAVSHMRTVAFAVADVAFVADLMLIPASMPLFGFHVAEGLGVPGIGVFLQPLAPTGDFPPSLAGTRSFGVRRTERWASSSRWANADGIGPDTTGRPGGPYRRGATAGVRGPG